jgi:nitric oxide reductase NorD protein
MAEPEEILIDAAERVTASTRAMWARRRARDAPETVSLAELRSWLQVLLRACFDADPPLLATDPAPAHGRLARTVGRVPSWQAKPAAAAFTDGTRLFLPRQLPLAAAVDPPRERFRMTALGLAARIARDSVRCCPREPLARDLYWSAQGAISDRCLAEELPGLAPELARMRRAALQARPAWRELRDVERRLEGFVQTWLRDVPLVGAHGSPPASVLGMTPDRVVRWAEQWTAAQPDAADYRGMAPVAHWGLARPDLVAHARKAPSAGRSTPAGERRRTPRSRRLERRIETRNETLDEDDAPGPILLASEDGHLSVQDPAGLRRPRDQGLDDPLDLDALSEELGRVPELARVREPGSVGEILEADDEELRADGGGRAAIPAPPGTGTRYPEWDYRLGDYRASHCIVRERAAPLGDPAWADAVRCEHGALFTHVRRLFDALRPRRELRRRRLDGAELDLDAFVEDHADRRAGLPSSDRLYLEPRANRRDVAVSFLVDASGSTDAWVAGHRSVLDVAKVATLVLCEALAALGDRHAIHAFSGQGASDVRVWRLKGFGEPAAAVAQRIAALVPDRYTRLGAPLRHLTAALVGEAAQRRLLLLLSDGKPNDDDAYEGRYGIEDTRQAVVEARALGIDVFCLTIDREGSAYLPRMFGPSGYAVLPHVRELPERLVDVYRRLTGAGR